MADAPDALLFLNRREARTVDALAGRILPGDESDPGAHEAGVVAYVDRGLAGFFRDQQGLYREGLRALDALCLDRHGIRFADLDAGHQDEVVAHLDALARAEEPGVLGTLFALAREHTIQGLFCDPAYGGNRDGVGWRLVGFPGARWGYDALDMARDGDATQIPLTTLADLRARVERSE